MRESLRLALDKSVRFYDEDGHLHVSMANISKAVVNPYRGNEIPEYQRLGLDPDKIYHLLRHPDELAKGAKTFSGKPILSVHRPTTASDHAKQITVGSVGSQPRFDGKYLQAPLTVWDAAAIDGIESDDQRELSCGYRYDADMTPGTYRGVRYDGVMRNIRGNHVALVESGRAGSDVIVGDAALVPASDASLIVKGPTAMKLSRAALLASGALRVYLAPKLATDAKVDLAPVLKGVTAKGWKTHKPRMVAALTAATRGKLAADASIEDVVQMLDQLDEVANTLPEEMPESANVAEPDAIEPDDATAEDDDGGMIDRLKEFLTGKLSPEDLEACMTMMKPEVAATDADPDADQPDADKDKDNKETPFPPKKKDAAMDRRAMDKRAMDKGGLTKTAMDAAIATAAAKSAKTAEQATIKRMNAIREAERIVRPWVGEVALGQDSAEAVYKLALDEAGIDLTGVPEIAYRALLSALPSPQAEAQERARTGRSLAMDAVGAKKFAERFPNANRLQKH